MTAEMAQEIIESVSGEVVVSGEGAVIGKRAIIIVCISISKTHR